MSYKAVFPVALSPRTTVRLRRIENENETPRRRETLTACEPIIATAYMYWMASWMRSAMFFTILPLFSTLTLTRRKVFGEVDPSKQEGAALSCSTAK